MKKISITFRGKDEEQVLAAITRSVAKIIENADVETGFLAKREQEVTEAQEEQEVQEAQEAQEVRQILIPSFMVNVKKNKRIARKLKRRRARYGKKMA